METTSWSEEHGCIISETRTAATLPRACGVTGCEAENDFSLVVCAAALVLYEHDELVLCPLGEIQQLRRLDTGGEKSRVSPSVLPRDTSLRPDMCRVGSKQIGDAACSASASDTKRDVLKAEETPVYKRQGPSRRRAGIRGTWKKAMHLKRFLSESSQHEERHSSHALHLEPQLVCAWRVLEPFAL